LDKIQFLQTKFKSKISKRFLNHQNESIKIIPIKLRKNYLMNQDLRYLFKVKEFTKGLLFKSLVLNNLLLLMID
jgi:hypothetical protein